MTLAPDQLKQIAEEVSAGRHPRVTVRTLLSWFEAERRGTRIRAWVRAALDEQKLTTDPDFRFVYMDAFVTFLPSPTEAPATETAAAAPREEPSEEPAVSPPLSPDATNPSPDGQPTPATTAAAAVLEPALQAALADPTYRIGKLAAANRKPESVTPDTTIQAALTIMLANDYSQLPVMTSERDVKGLISWKSIATRLGLKKATERVRDCMGKHQQVSEDDSLFSAIAIIAAHESVLVRGKDNRVIGIVTTTDLALTFDQLGEPFLLLGEIENQVRSILAHLPLDDIKTAKAPGDADDEIESVADLTFGGYVRLLENPDIWKKLNLPIDRSTFVKELQRVRDIRNDVMHFDPEGLGPGDLGTLRRLGKFMQVLRDAGVTSGNGA